MRMAGKTVHTVNQDRTTTGRFTEYLQNTLIPMLSEDDFIVMDNMHSQHAKTVKQVLDTSGILYLYLSSYSPGLNLIEKMWSMIEAYLRKVKVRTTSELPDAIERVFSTVHFSDCVGWFRSCNYVQ